MKTDRKSRLLLAGAVCLSLASVAVLAAPPADKNKRDPDDFVRGKSNTRGARATPPRTEAQAVAQRRVLPSGIVELEVPEDRMLDLTAVRRADGTVVLVHRGEGAEHPQAVVTGGDVE